VNRRSTRSLLAVVLVLLTLPAALGEAAYRYGVGLLPLDRPAGTISPLVADAAWVALRQRGPRELPAAWPWPFSRRQPPPQPDMVAALAVARDESRRLHPRWRWSLALSSAAAWIRRHLTADQALTLWLQRAWFADRIQGIDQAAARLAGKPAAQLDAAEAAGLVALAVRPALGSRPADWKDERDRILRGLHERGTIDAGLLARSLQRPLPSPVP
jgi:hypothetical protein